MKNDLASDSSKQYARTSSKKSAASDMWLHLLSDAHPLLFPPFSTRSATTSADDSAAPMGTPWFHPTVSDMALSGEFHFTVSKVSYSI